MVGVRPTKVKKFKITFAVLLLERSIKNKNILNINLNLHLFIILNLKLLCQGQSHLCTVYYVFFLNNVGSILYSLHCFQNQTPLRWVAVDCGSYSVDVLNCSA